MDILIFVSIGLLISNIAFNFITLIRINEVEDLVDSLSESLFQFKLEKRRRQENNSFTKTRIDTQLDEDTYLRIQST